MPDESADLDKVPTLSENRSRPIIIDVENITYVDKEVVLLCPLRELTFESGITVTIPFDWWDIHTLNRWLLSEEFLMARIRVFASHEFEERHEDGRPYQHRILTLTRRSPVGTTEATPIIWTFKDEPIRIVKEMLDIDYYGQHIGNSISLRQDIELKAHIRGLSKYSFYIFSAPSKNRSKQP